VHTRSPLSLPDCAIKRHGRLVHSVLPPLRHDVSTARFINPQPSDPNLCMTLSSNFGVAFFVTCNSCCLPSIVDAPVPPKLMNPPVSRRLRLHRTQRLSLIPRTLSTPKQGCTRMKCSTLKKVRPRGVPFLFNLFFSPRKKKTTTTKPCAQRSWWNTTLQPTECIFSFAQQQQRCTKIMKITTKKECITMKTNRGPTLLQ
jgi:hypothetical protein